MILLQPWVGPSSVVRKHFESICSVSGREEKRDILLFLIHKEPFRDASRAGAFIDSPPRYTRLTAHRTSHRDRPRPREKVEYPDS